MNVKLFFGRKNEVVGELDEALVIFATTFGVELKSMVMNEMGLVLMLVVEAMQARLGSVDKAARQSMVLGAIVKLHVPSHRDEKHHEGHQQ